jgi:hypothetical protein
VKNETTTMTGAEVLRAIINSGKPDYLNLGDRAGAYSVLFWRPFLGAPAHALYVTLLALAESAAALTDGQINVEMMARMMGQGNRYTILGREASGKRPLQVGVVDVLEACGIVRHWRRRSGRERRHAFDVLPTLPLLTPSQAATLPNPLAVLHDRYLGALPGIRVQEWREIETPSFIPQAVERYGMVRVEDGRRK